MSPPKALVLTGFGLNCDNETAFALKTAGADPERIHLNALIEGNRNLRDFQIFIIGGGFSWGDDHGAGVIMAMRIKHRLSDALRDFVGRGGLVLGICNGFQVLVNLGLLPLFEPPELRREVALIGNDCGNFRDQWVKLAVNRASPCVFTRGMDIIDLPVRHGEGKFYADPMIVHRIETQKQVIMRYATLDGAAARGAFPHNPNGSVGDIAGICDPTGRIAGLMPHPEAFNHVTNHPDWTVWKEQCRRAGTNLSEEGKGIQLFRNAVEFFL
jgi:phosphoribosylformylglycinamidine synthase subunit PurQ / glutaminase